MNIVPYNLRNRFFKKRPKTYLQQINSFLILGNIFGCIYFSIEARPIWSNIIISLPMQLLHLAWNVDFWMLYNEIAHDKSEVLNKPDTLFTIISFGILFMQPLYFLINRRQHRKLYLKIQQINNFLNIEKKMYLRVNFELIVLIFSLITLNIVFTTMMYKSTKITNFGYYGIKGLTDIVYYINDYIEYLTSKEIQSQYIAINSKLKEIEDHEYTPQTKIKIINDLMKMYSEIASSSLNTHFFFNASIVITLTSNLLMLIWMSTFLVSSLSMVETGQIDNIELLYIASLLRIVMALVNIRYKVSKWKNVSNEVSN